MDAMTRTQHYRRAIELLEPIEDVARQFPDSFVLTQEDRDRLALAQIHMTAAAIPYPRKELRL